MKPSVPVDLSILSELNRTYPYAKLQAWFMAQQIRDTMLWKGAAEEQVMFVRDQFYYMFQDDLMETSVVGTHTSKSIQLPVYQIHLKGDIVLTMRGNFHDWKVSVESPTPLEFPTNLFSPYCLREDVHQVYCEGFQADQVFGSYTTNKQCFTVELHDKMNLYVFMFLLREQMLKLNA